MTESRFGTWIAKKPLRNWLATPARWRRSLATLRATSWFRAVTIQRFAFGISSTSRYRPPRRGPLPVNLANTLDGEWNENIRAHGGSSWEYLAHFAICALVII